MRRLAPRRGNPRCLVLQYWPLKTALTGSLSSLVAHDPILLHFAIHTAFSGQAATIPLQAFMLPQETSHAPVNVVFDATLFLHAFILSQFALHNDPFGQIAMRFSQEPIP